MINFKPGDRVRYTNNRKVMLSDHFDSYIGRVGTVTRGDDNGDGHVNVAWDEPSSIIGYPYVENLELIEEAPVEHENGNFTTVNELIGIVTVVNAFNDTLPNGRVNTEVSAGNLALYDCNGDVLGYVAYNPDVSAWVFYDPTFKDV